MNYVAFWNADMNWLQCSAASIIVLPRYFICTLGWKSLSCVFSAECALEDETYEDGAETQVECNRCVCACGNWVCTAMTCTGKFKSRRCSICYLFFFFSSFWLAHKCLVNISDCYVTSPDKTAAVDESTDTGAEMTEEEWNLRVAELNKHQVWLCNLRNPCKWQKNVMKWLISRHGQSVCQSAMLPTPHLHPLGYRAMHFHWHEP